MKITTNFSTPAGRMMPYLAGMFLLLGVFFVLIAITLFVLARNALSDIPVNEERLAHYRNLEIPKTVGVLPSEKLFALRSRVRELNELTNTNGPTLPLLLSRLEKLLPDGVWLVNLQYRSRENDIKLIAEADYAAQLTEFMGQLESSAYFSQVLLTRQSQAADEKQRTIQFEIQLKGKP